MRSKSFELLVPSLVLLALACNDKGVVDTVPVAEVRVTPSSRSIPVGGTLQLNAFVLDAQGGTLTGRSVVWSSSAPTIATVSATGFVTGVSGGGPVTMTASSEGRPGTAQVTVTGPALIATVSITPGAPSILVGTAVQLVATAKDAQGNTQYNRAVTWSSSTEAVATVDAAGIVTGASAGGPVTITATSEGKTGTAQVTVRGAPFILTLSSSTLSTVQGAANPTTTVNVVRDNFAGPVSLHVGWDGADHDVMPPGVTAAFSPNPGTGNSAVLTLLVGPAATPGVYPLFVFAGASTGGYCCIPLTLTVTAPPPGPPGYAFSLPQDLSVSQGSTSLVSPLYLFRTGFTGNVTLSVDNLPTGVTAYFYPVNPTTGDSTRFWLNVAPDAVPGSYGTLLVRGVTAGLADRTAPLTLTVTQAPVSLTLSSPTLSIVQGAATSITTVNLVRNNFAGPVALHVGWYDEDHDVLPPGVTAAFAPDPATGNGAVLTLTVGAATTPGVYFLFVYAGASTGGWCCIPLTLTVIAASP